MPKQFIQSLFKKMDMQIVRYTNTDDYRLINLIEKNDIDVIIDCGANTGTYGEKIRQLGYGGDIISFEPIKRIYDELKKNAEKDDKWSAYNFALGDCNEKQIINISENLSSSSILDMLPLHVKTAPNTKTVDTEKIEVRKLSSIYNDLDIKEKIIYFKIDVQGYEHKVLDGAEEILDKFRGLQVEMSLVQLYDESLVLNDMLDKISKYGFTLMGILPVFWDPNTHQMLQVDGIFYR